MTSKLLVVLLLVCSASLVLGVNTGQTGRKLPLQRRADGLISSLLNWTGTLTQSAVDKIVSGGHMGLNMIEGLINFFADSAKSGADMVLRRRRNASLGYEGITSMINKAQADLDSTWKGVNQLAQKVRPTLSERGKSVLDMYMNEAKVSRAHYTNALQDAAATAADLNNRISSSPISDQENVWELIQDKYSIEMVDYGQQIHRLGNVLKNNGLDL